MLRRLFVPLALALSALAVPFSNAHAKDAPVFTGTFSNVAVGGYDAVAYFVDGKPVKGDKAFSLEHAGAQWRFASAQNRDRFAAAPARYAPQYGGYCAWAVSQGYTASGDPQYWKIVDDKLYLNYDASVQRKWEQDIPGFIAKAQQNWPSVLDK
jgi:YHS domain-containing protein